MSKKSQFSVKLKATNENVCIVEEYPIIVRKIAMTQSSRKWKVRFLFPLPLPHLQEMNIRGLVSLFPFLHITQTQVHTDILYPRKFRQMEPFTPLHNLCCCITSSLLRDLSIHFNGCIKVDCMDSVIPYWMVIGLTCFQVFTLESNSKIKSPQADQCGGFSGINITAFRMTKVTKTKQPMIKAPPLKRERPRENGTQIVCSCTTDL